MKSFVIHLQRAPERLRRFMTSAAAHGWEVEIFPAVDRADLRLIHGPAGVMAVHARDSHTRLQAAAPAGDGIPLHEGHFACALSHMTLWRRILSEGWESACVFEDDAILLHPPRLPVIPENADFVFLNDRVGGLIPDGISGESEKELWLRENPFLPMVPGRGLEAYLVTRRGAAKALEIMREMFLPVDLQLFSCCHGARLGDNPLCRARRPGLPECEAWVTADYFAEHRDLGYSYVNPPYAGFADKRPLAGNAPFLTCRVTPGEGMGSMALRYVSVMTAARKYGRTYVHTPFHDVGHRPAGYPGGAGQWEADWERFFNLGAGEARDVTAEAYEWCYREVAGGDFQDMEGPLRRKYHAAPKPETGWFSSDAWNIAIHIRRGDALLPANQARVTDDGHILTLLREVLGKSAPPEGKPVKIHVMSEGQREDFEFLSVLPVDVVPHLDECPFTTFHHLVMADVLVTSKSTFSHLAGILSEGVVFHERFWHDALPRWHLLEGNFPPP